jgi:hypothetical protein
MEPSARRSGSAVVSDAGVQDAGAPPPIVVRVMTAVRLDQSVSDFATLSDHLPLVLDLAL